MSVPGPEIRQSCGFIQNKIVEMHHKFKKDAPSGTAISLGKTIAKAKIAIFGTVDFDMFCCLTSDIKITFC